MPAKRPASFTVFAVLCIVFASIGLLCDFIGLASQAASKAIAGAQAKNNPGQLDQQEMQKEFETKLPAYLAYQWGTMAVSFVMHVILLATGIGLLRMLPWSRPMCIVYGVLTILIQLGVMVYTLAFITPLLDELLNKQFEKQGTPVTVPGWALSLGVILGSLLGMTYAIILLIFALRPKMAQQLAGAGNLDTDTALGRQEPQDFYDEDYQRQRHEPPPEL